jgi:hypothetical protein
MKIGSLYLRWPVILIISIIMISILLVVLAPGHAKASPASPWVSLDIDLNPDLLVAKVTNSQNGPVTFSGNATVDKLQTSLERVTVTLTSDCDWTSMVTPSTMVFSDPGTKPFDMTVIVPPTTPPISRQATVYGSAKNPVLGEDEASATVTVRVAQYFRHNMTLDYVSTTKVEPGDTIHGSFTLKNEGNGPDVITFKVEDSGGLSSYEIPDSVSIPAGGELDITFELHTDKDFQPHIAGEVKNVNIRGKSQGALEHNILYTQRIQLELEFVSLGKRFVDDLPLYLGAGIALALTGTVIYIVVRKRRNRSINDEEENSRDNVR